MNSLLKNLAVCAIVGVSGAAQAITVGVDSNQTWNGYMNVFNLPSAGGAFQFGTSWGTGDLVAVFNGGTLKLSPNTIGDPNSYWYTPSGGPGAAGNKIMAASMYVEVNDNSLSGQSVTFTGEILSKTFTSAHSTTVFIKDFDPGYGSFNVASVPVSAAGVFSITLATAAGPGRHVQYGFETTGPNVWTTDVAPFGSVVIKNVPVPVTILNGDFEIPGGAGWATSQGTPTYPTSGGNPNGNGVLTSGGGFAVLYAFNNTEKTFASLGLAPGKTYTLQMDMKVISGSIGGIRLEGPAGYVVDQFAPANTGGAGWATYSFELTVPNSPAQAKFGLRTPDGSSVAFDNVKIVLPGPPAAPVATIKTGTLVGWTAPSAVNTYQAQSSPNNADWTNVGPVFTGNSVTGVFDPEKAPFYQVLMTTPATPGNAVLNPGFENNDISTTPANNWMIAPLFNATASTVGIYGALTPHGGSKMLLMDAQTSGGGSPAEVGVRSNDFIAVTAGTAYSLSFYAANQVTGASFVLGAKLRYYNDFNSEIGLSTETEFSNVGAAWTQVTKAFTTPAGTAYVKVDFFLRSGAVPSVQWVTLIDDVTLITPLIPGDTTVLAATAVPGVEVSWKTLTGSNYQVSTSGNLSGWSNFGSSITGNGSIWSIVDAMSIPSKFYRVLQTTP